MKTPRFALLSFLLAVACGRQASGPLWQDLADSLAASVTGEATLFESGLERPIKVVEEQGFTYLSTVIARDEWHFDANAEGGLWIAKVSLLGIGVPPGDLPSQLLGNGAIQFRHEAPNALSQLKPLTPGRFHAATSRVLLKLSAGEEPPEGLELKVFAQRAFEVDGRRRVRGRQYAGEGFALLPGQALEIPVRLPQDSVLSFTVCSEPAAPLGAQRSLRFRLLLDGAPLWEHAVTRLGRSVASHHRVPIPEGDANAGRLRFEVSGPLSYASILAPTLGPEEPGRYGQRPWGASRPDIVVFLADTFRADNLEAYGGDARLTPFLNDLARESMVFRRAWSTGTFTLPAHVSMFTGAYPRQAGIVGTGRALPEAWRTLAERLTEAGYRTGAVTDGGIVTQQFGLDQGFAWWDERASDLESTLERTRAFLDADDGRPIFLFVQTYRAHLPYVVTPETREELGDWLNLDGDWATLNRRIKVLSAQSHGSPSDPERLAEWNDIRMRLHDLYRGGSRDLDRGLARFSDDLARRGLEQAYLLFTSDHGEAFLEHDVLYHTGKVWEELARIPLLLRGPDLPVGPTNTPASLIDIAPTIADLAGLEAESQWRGTSLCRLPAERPLFIFECRKRDGSTLAILEGDHKVISFEDPGRLLAGELDGVYDLARDPREERNLVDFQAPWSQAILGTHAHQAARYLDPLIDPAASRLDADKTEQLGQLGYADE